MIPFILKLSKQQKQKLQSALKRAEVAGDMPKMKRILAIILLGKENSIQSVANILQNTAEAIRSWFKKYILNGLRGLSSRKSPGRPPKLTKKQRKELAMIIEAGPEQAGLMGACWRSPMIQYLINERFGVFYNARYISELLKSIGFSYQKARFVASKRDKEARKEWLEKTWPEIMKLTQKQKCFVLFGDEASFPQWGSLSYTWARVGKQPTILTSGTRKSYKVFGLIDYFTGRFFAKGHEGKLNGGSYIEFIKDVLSKTRKHLILIQDGAPYHKGKDVREFFEEHSDRITIFQLPTYSPDYNPIEKLWKKIKEKGIHLKYFPTFDDLTNTVEQMLVFFGDVKSEVMSLFGFYNEMTA